MIKAKTRTGKTVSKEKLDEVYEKLKTPFKRGAVLKFDKEMCDSACVYSYNGKWYMSFIKISYDTKNSGYDSHIAESEDLINWKYLTTTMRRNNSDSWDCNQIACYPAFVDIDFNGGGKIQKVNDKYYFAYLGGALTGYETDPLAVGMCKCTDILDITTYQKLPSPVLAPYDSDAREGEKLSLFKSFMFVDKDKTLGYTYVNAYNARGESRRETVYLAVSNDGENWERYGECSIVKDDNEWILGDPQIIKIGDLFVMVYFVLKDGKTYNTFACSYDLLNWTKWTGKHLIESEYEWESKYAHKPWIVVHNGVVYHYYCAVDDKGERFIALATSKEI